ncbi:MAG TPA: VTT domain-containing protein [Blastocatellia bacterium]|nr:VTT domain-containing protein [Blastocatellia bacterium]
MFDSIQAWFIKIAGQVVIMPLYWAAPMMVLIAVADSSLLSLPEVNDIITVTRIAHNPNEVFYFPLFPAIGSVIGCLILYRIARQGRNFITKRFQPNHLDMVEQLYRRWGIWALAVPALLPPPLPFKIFVATAGALGYPLKRFMITIMLARMVRYYFWGVAAYFMREQVLQALEWLKEHFSEVLIAVLSLFAVIIIGRWIIVFVRNRSLKNKTAASFTD